MTILFSSTLKAKNLCSQHYYRSSYTASQSNTRNRLWYIPSIQEITTEVSLWEDSVTCTEQKRSGFHTQSHFYSHKNRPVHSCTFAHRTPSPPTLGAPFSHTQTVHNPAGQLPANVSIAKDHTESWPRGYNKAIPPLSLSLWARKRWFPLLALFVAIIPHYLLLWLWSPALKAVFSPQGSQATFPGHIYALICYHTYLLQNKTSRTTEMERNTRGTYCRQPKHPNFLLFAIMINFPSSKALALVSQLLHLRIYFLKDVICTRRTEPSEPYN